MIGKCILSASLEPLGCNKNLLCHFSIDGYYTMMHSGTVILPATILGMMSLCALLPSRNGALLVAGGITGTLISVSEVVLIVLFEYWKVQKILVVCFHGLLLWRFVKEFLNGWRIKVV